MHRLRSKKVTRSNERKWTHPKRSREPQIITDAHYAYDIELLANIYVQEKCLLHSVKKVLVFKIICFKRD